MTDNMVAMWKDMMCAIFNCIDENYVRFVFFEDYCPITVESFVEHMLLEFCKYTFYEKSPKHPLRYYIPYSSSDNSERMLYSRTLKYIQKFRDHNYSVIVDNGGDAQEYQKMTAKPMDTIDSRKEGYELSEMDFFEATTIHDLTLVKSISENRIYSSKKVSNSTFIELFREYDDWVEKLIERSQKSDKDMIFASIAFFTFEWKYNIEYYYNLSEYLIEQDISKIDYYTAWLFTGTLDFNSSMAGNIGTDSRMIKDRIDLIPEYFDKTNHPYLVEIMKAKFLEVLTMKVMFMTMTSKVGGKYIDWFADSVNDTDIASFFKDYDVFSIWKRKSFNNERIKKLRYILELTSPFNKTKE